MALRFITVVFLVALAPSLASAHDIWRFGFYVSFEHHEYEPRDIPWEHYTHVAQMAVMPTEGCGIDDTTRQVSRVRDDFVAEARKSGTKALITLLQDRTLAFIKDCTTPAKIDGFVANIAAYVYQHGYDGLDLDWEAGFIADQFKALVRGMRAAMPDKILTADLAVHNRFTFKDVQHLLDRINLMGYDGDLTDYGGRALKQTWHNAAVRSDGDIREYKSQEANLYYLLSSGIEPGKINMGFPFYGYVNQDDNGVAHPKQTFQNKRRMQIEYRHIAGSPFGNTTPTWDAARRVEYIAFPGAPAGCRMYPCEGRAFVTKPSARQARESVSMLLEKKLGGIMTFALHQEFLRHEIGDARYPLTLAIVQELRRRGR